MKEKIVVKPLRFVVVVTDIETGEETETWCDTAEAAATEMWKYEESETEIVEVFGRNGGKIW